MIKHRRDAGFSLAALIFFATAVSILLSAAVPAYQMQARREREEELIFRGQEYTRAIQKYQRKFGIYPPSIDALVQTNGLRFVRRLYRDPITGKDFRLISINPDGSVSGSTLFSQRVNNVPLFGANTQIFGQQSASPPPPPAGNRGGQPPAPAGNRGGQPPPQPPGVNRGGQPPPPGNNNTGVPSVTSGIIGVASDSTESSIMVYNNRQKYNEWEFVAILGQPGQPNAPPNGAAPAPPLFPAQGNKQPEPQPLKRP